jgi:predicted TIM-barrel fold metal-dependent hydrolase
MKLDAFNHFSPAPYFAEFCRLQPQHPAATLFRRRPELYDTDARLRLVDAVPDYAQILCLANPPLEAIAGPDESPRLARLGNDALAATCKAWPDRFPGFIAGLPMNNPTAAVAEARRAVRELGACGVQIFTNVNGVPLSEPQYFDLFATMAELDRPILVHPIRMGNHADYASESKSEAEVWFTFGWPYETSACMTRLVYSGLFDRLPSLKILTHHYGGMIPFFAEKITLGFEQIFFGTMERNPLAERAGLKRPPLDYFRMLYADTATNGSVPAMQCGHAFFGSARTVFATDAPFDPDGGIHLVRRTIAAVEALPVPAAEKAQILEGNARAMFGLGPAR